MNPTIILAVAFLAIAHEANSACLCGGFGSGKDLCSLNRPGKPCSSMVIRPAHLPTIKVESITKPRVVCQTLPGIINTFKPVGDLCSCKQSIVVPAVVPRPVCSCSSHSESNSDSSSSSHHSNTYLNSGNVVLDGADTEYVVEEQGPTAAVVDPVSLCLAYKEQNKACAGISEGRLAYGFRKLPVEVVDERAVQEDFDEHALYAHNGQIVELKKINCGAPTINVDEEALEDLEEAEAEYIEDSGARGRSGIKTLRYGDVGFGLAKIKTNPFREIDIVEVNSQPEEVVGEPTRICDDGYKPGNVIFKNTPVRETYTVPAGVPADCSGERTNYRPYYTYSTSSSSSSSTSASSKNNCHKCSHQKPYY